MSDSLALPKTDRSRTPPDVTAYYDRYHGERFRYLLAACREIAAPTASVLDVGASHFTDLLCASFRSVTTLGFPRNGDPWAHTDHIIFDLNETQSGREVPTDERFDLIVFAEVIEHLHTAPELTLKALARLLKPDGHVIVQTPNAATLNKRLLLLAGRNPYERIRLEAYNPGHFREYTKNELIEIAGTVGLRVVSHEYREYFGTSGGFFKRTALNVMKAIAAIYPPFARGQTIILST